MPSPRNNLWFPFYVGDYLANSLSLTTQQHGAALLLLCQMFIHGEIPDDNRLLANVTRLDLPTWRRERKAIEPLFQIAGGVWRSAWMDEQKARAAEVSERRSTNANARWSRYRAEAKAAAEEAAKTITQVLGDPHPEQSDSKSTASGMQLHSKTDAPGMQMHSKGSPNAMTYTYTYTYTDREREREGGARGAEGALRTAAGILLKRLRGIEAELKTTTPDARGPLLEEKAAYDNALRRIQDRQLRGVGPLLQKDKPKDPPKDQSHETQ